MSSQDDDQDFRTAVGVIIFSVFLAVGIAVGVGIYKARGVSTPAPVATPVSVPPVVLPAAEAVQAAAPSEPVVAEAPAAAAPVAADTNGSVVVDNGVVKFYFATGRADLPTGAVSALQTAIDAARSGKRLLIAGFHDATGSRSRNEALAKQRALAVRAALLQAGVVEKQIELRKPEQSIGSGDAAQARRVEVTIID
jgi:outer membrane protein OmpA-like peptidoglycan-associated protein